MQLTKVSLISPLCAVMRAEQRTEILADRLTKELALHIPITFFAPNKQPIWGESRQMVVVLSMRSRRRFRRRHHFLQNGYRLTVQAAPKKWHGTRLQLSALVLALALLKYCPDTEPHSIQGLQHRSLRHKLSQSPSLRHWSA